eukprot:7752775-Alexandrium_andersonii.AAC.1
MALDTRNWPRHNSDNARRLTQATTRASQHVTHLKHTGSKHARTHSKLGTGGRTLNTAHDTPPATQQAMLSE